jgi:hypothetical protein
MGRERKMPTIQITNNEDGWAYMEYYAGAYSTTGASYAYKSVNINRIAGLADSGPPSNRRKEGAWARFTGITIPQGSTINSATFTPHLAKTSVSFNTFQAWVDSRSAPPATPIPQSILGSLTGGPLTGPPNGIGGGSFSIYSGNTPVTTTGGYQTNGIDFTTEIQQLVTNYDYNNDAMMFYLGKISVTFTPSAAAGTKYGAMYGLSWGAIKAPDLSITYTLDNSSSSSSDSSSSSPGPPQPKTTFKFV